MAVKNEMEFKNDELFLFCGRCLMFLFGGVFAAIGWLFRLHNKNTDRLSRLEGEHNARYKTPKAGKKKGVYHNGV